MNEPNVAINMSGLDFRQDVEPLIKEFYPLLYNEAGGVTVSFVLEDDRMRLAVGAAPDAGAAVQVCDAAAEITEDFSSEETDAKKRHREYRNQLLRALYRLLSGYTGKELPWGVLTGVRPTKLIFERLERGEAKHRQLFLF